MYKYRLSLRVATHSGMLCPRTPKFLSTPTNPNNVFGSNAAVGTSEKTKPTTASSSSSVIQKETLFNKFSKKLFPAAVNLSPQEVLEEKYLAVGVPLLYSCCSSGFDFVKFLEIFQLPDTIDTWYRLTYLHMWMILVRVSNENRDFYDDFRDEFIPVLWNDCTARLKKLKTVPGFTIRSKEIRLWVDNFYYELFFGMQEYDEALLTDDTVLASALWRNVFDKAKTYDVIALNYFVKYVRMHIYALHKTDIDALMLKGYKFRLPSS